MLDPYYDDNLHVIRIKYLKSISWRGDILEDDIKIINRKEFDMKGAVLIEGFPSVGMVSTIVSNYLIKILKLDYVGSVSSRHFYPTAIVTDSIPMPPLRIYAGKPMCEDGNICSKVVVLTSEFPPPTELMKPLVDNIIEWSDKVGIKQIISVEGIVNTKASTVDGVPDNNDGNTYGVASSNASREILKGLKSLTPLENGVITGISGVLLYEAERLGGDVICLLADAHSDYPDARAAARLIVSLDHFLPKIKLDPQPLIDEAELLESQLKKAVKQAQPALTRPPAVSDVSQHMYG